MQTVNNKFKGLFAIAILSVEEFINAKYVKAGRPSIEPTNFEQ